LIVSLFMGWRQRRRRARETYDPPPVVDPPAVDTAETVPRRRPRTAPGRRSPADKASWPPPTGPQPTDPPLTAPLPAVPPPAGPPPAGPPLAGPPPIRRQPHGPPPNRPQPARPQPGRPHVGRLPATGTPPPRPPATGVPPNGPGLLAAPVSPPEPPRPTPVPERDFGDDPLGTGYILPTYEVSTPLADQSWETVLRDRRRDGLPRAGRPNEHDGNGGGRPPADGEPGGDHPDLPRFETRFRRPPEP
jgi:hypothetical protein